MHVKLGSVLLFDKQDRNIRIPSKTYTCMKKHMYMHKKVDEHVHANESNIADKSS